MEEFDPRYILATNLKALLAYAGEVGEGPSNGVELQRATEARHPGAGVSDSTISRYIHREASANLDHLRKIAEAFDLCVWQLMYPGLEPGNVPVLRKSPAEKELYELLRAGMKLLTTPGAVDAVEAGTNGAGADDSHHRAVSSKNAPKRTV